MRVLWLAGRPAPQKMTASRIVVIVPEMTTDARGKFASAVPTA
jgi:hypothetical protein